MLANKHTIYLSKNYRLDSENHNSTNVFMFNESGSNVQAQWCKKNIENNQSCFVVLDHNDKVLKATQRILQQKNYYIDLVDLSHPSNHLHINPFDLIQDSSEIHFMFLSFLYALWDNEDKDITAMSNLIDAFANCMIMMFEHKKEQLNMRSLKKLVSSLKSTCPSEEGEILVSDGIFANIKDQNSMACKYYAQCKKATRERFEEVAGKVVQFFDMFSEEDLEMMSSTDSDLEATFEFKTSIFLNINREEDGKTARLLFILLNYFVQRMKIYEHTMFILDRLSAPLFICLPYWMKSARSYNTSYCVIASDISQFKKTPYLEKYFRNIKKTLGASILVHENKAAKKYENQEPSNIDEVNEELMEDPIATILIPQDEVSTQDELF